MAQQTDPGEARRRIDQLVGSPHAQPLVDAYFEPERGFAGSVFDGLDEYGLLADNPPGRFTGDDIAASSLLDVRFGPKAVRTLLTSQELADALDAVPPRCPLWEADQPELQAASGLWSLIREIPGVGRTKASKLLARKRPELVPIVDSVISEALQLRFDTWRPIADALKDEGLRQRIDDLRPTRVTKPISTLRILDVVVWMSCSRSKAAVQVQLEVGAPATRSLT
ncbi:DUF6308 family protein [Nocardioides donggukensis]|uniref:Uncharacterized protein n=1 Tax=Nocardioides donggukensis TaxID=2774019 RepID=A0A927KBB0_9ACTN|nr:DUF6308 family protein [Nocardioides donggukensis]MBD8871151.1 hypothetical protein [Nocardioides donggukensis]